VGQKVHPTGFRLGITKPWESRWYARKDYSKFLHEDLFIRKEIKRKFYHAGVSRVDIERAANRAKITIHTARPGIIIGRKGAEIEQLRRDLQQSTGKQILINIEEINKPDLDARLLAESVSAQLLRRIGFRRAMKKTVLAAMKAGAQGVRIACKGRLGGAEMSRGEWYREGRVPLHTLRADIDYGFTEARTKYGMIGVKVWLFKGEIFEEPPVEAEPLAGEAGSEPTAT
jgi:small subunit ribosomal protein S3